MGKYARTLNELKKKAILFWPPELIKKEAAVSVLPLLLKTQDKFISVLTLSDSKPDSWKKFVDASKEMKGNTFLKHLMVLSDLGGEALNKLPPLSKYFKNDKMKYIWGGKKYEYKFKVIQNKTTLANSALHADGPSLIKGYALDEKMEDVVMLIMHGASSIGDSLPDVIKSKCMIGSLIGEAAELKTFVKQNYIRISRQMGGATANSLGQIAQDYVLEMLQKKLTKWHFKRNGTLPGVSHTGGETETNFDIVAKSPNGKCFGIEVSFQFTTNSTIERKAGQAKARADMVHEAGHWICYVIDGAGNINIRESAVKNICQYSDCTVALTSSEIGVLTEFMRAKAGV